MPFTDDDFKRLKERFRDHTAHCQDCSCTFGNEELPALIARLEAAEKVCEFADWYWPKGEANLEAAIVTWRKTCGK